MEESASRPSRGLTLKTADAHEFDRERDFAQRVGHADQDLACRLKLVNTEAAMTGATECPPSLPGESKRPEPAPLLTTRSIGQPLQPSTAASVMQRFEGHGQRKDS